MTDQRPEWTGRRVEVEVGAVAHGGHCVARVEGRVVFVRHALPGERVVAVVTEDRGGSFCRADAVEVVSASPNRVEPPCPLAGPGRCGGCDWQHASGPAQRELKAAVVAEQLRRLAGLDVRVVVEELPGGLLAWRTRTRMAVDRAGAPGFRAYRSHDVIPVAHCPISVPGLVESVAGHTWTPNAELELAKDGTGQVHALQIGPLPTNQRRQPARRPAQRRVTGSGVVTEFAAGRKWEFSAGGFWQVHPSAADTLASVVEEWAAVPPGACAWDLYSGVGLFASVLAGQAGSQGTVLAVESSAEAVGEGGRNLADLPQVRFVSGKVERVLSGAELPPPEVVVLDPPRKGAGHAVVDGIAERSPARVIYVACDPAALARDLARFATHGYRLDRLRAFDAFPMTHHVECVALLTRMGH
jgi:tRNA/tmRNA/rRNA uracil-C5-methylase (TrmA/RlmC/RlmD family)